MFDGFVQAATADTPGLDQGVPGHLLQHGRPGRHRGQLPGLAGQLEPGRGRLGPRRGGLHRHLVRVAVQHQHGHVDLGQVGADQVLPLDKTAKRLPGLITDVQLTVSEGGPLAIPWTHAGQVNTALLDFLGR